MSARAPGTDWLHVTAFDAEMPLAVRRLGRATAVVGTRAAWPPGGPSLPGTGPVVVLGACGALVDAVGKGALVLATAVVGRDGRRLLPDPACSAALAAAAERERVTPLAVVAAEGRGVVDAPSERAALAAATGASVVDLETAGIARLCATAGRPWVALRWVTDTPTRPIGWLRTLLGAWPATDPAPARVALALVRRPWLAPRLVALARLQSRCRRRAGRTMERMAFEA